MKLPTDQTAKSETKGFVVYYCSNTLALDSLSSACCVEGKIAFGCCGKVTLAEDSCKL